MDKMNIVELTPDLESDYFCCLEDWSVEMKEAGDHKQTWYNQAKNRGLRVKIALNEQGKASGMIQYMPAEQAHFNGKELYVILCIWVHGHRKGVGNQQGRGIGTALLNAAETDVRQLGGKGLVAWGLSLPFFMRASWFKRKGYSVVDKEGFMRLLWKPFSQDASPPTFIKPVKIPPADKEKVNISAFINGWCPAQNIVFERTRRVAQEFPGEIQWCEYHTTDQAIFNEWRISDDIFINGRKLKTGPPPSINKIRRKVSRAVRKTR